MSVHLRSQEDQVDEEENIVQLDVFVCERFAYGTLCKAYAPAGRTVIGLAVAGV